MQTIFQTSATDSNFFGPFCNCLGLALVCKQSVCALVAILGCLSGPPNISRFVVSIVVDTVKRMLTRRSRTNVGEECGKVANPLRKHRDSAAAVPWVCLVVLIAAASLYIGPSLIFRRAPHSMLSPPFNTNAPATFNNLLSAKEPRLIDNHLSTAIANALPAMLSAAWTSSQKAKVFNHIDDADSLASQVCGRSVATVPMLNHNSLLNRLSGESRPDVTSVGRGSFIVADYARLDMNIRT